MEGNMYCLTSPLSSAT